MTIDRNTGFSENRLSSQIVQQVPDALIYADLEGIIRVWNRGAEELFGFSETEALGSSLDLIIAERFRERHWLGYHAAMKNGHTRLGNQVRTTRAVHKDGRKLYVDLSFGVICDDDGVTRGSVAMGRINTTRT